MKVLKNLTQKEAENLLKKSDKDLTREEVFQLGKYSLEGLYNKSKYLHELYMQEICYEFQEEGGW